jgi:hypothetical protein
VTSNQLVPVRAGRLRAGPSGPGARASRGGARVCRKQRPYGVLAVSPKRTATNANRWIPRVYSRRSGLSRCVESVVARSRRPPRPYAPCSLRTSCPTAKSSSHDPTHRPQRPPNRRDKRPVGLSGRQARTATGGTRPTCHLVPRSLTAPRNARPARQTGTRPARPASLPTRRDPQKPLSSRPHRS